MHNSFPNLAIIGGGAIGLSLAWELATRSCRVTIFDGGDFDSGTTSAASGILPPANFVTATDPIEKLRGLSHQMFPQWSDRLLEQTGIDIGLRPCGGLYLADRPGEAAAILGLQSYWQDLGIESSSMSIDECRRKEPSLRGPALDRMLAGLWAPTEYRISPRMYAAALRSAAIACGVTTYPHTPVDQVYERSDGVRVEVGKQAYDFDVAILCAGPQLGTIARHFRLEKSIIPVRGQIVQYQMTKGVLSSVINVGNRYLINRDDGTLIVGSCEEEAGFNPTTTPTVIESLCRFAESLIPAVVDAPIVETWAGLRPLTFDGFPMIGKIPGLQNLYVAGGHYRSGIHLSPGTATVLSDIILGQNPVMDLASFSVAKQQSTLTSQR
jgi:glycine oxidase